MKNKLYYLLAATMIMSVAHAENNKLKGQPVPPLKAQSVMHRDTMGYREYPDYYGEYELNRAQGMVKGSTLLQDVCVYQIAGEERLAVGYVSGLAATQVGYNGFKVGDRVTWMPVIDMHDTTSNGFETRYFTGKIDMLDSDKCYIKVDGTNRVAVKLYEDIHKLNP